MTTTQPIRPRDRVHVDGGTRVYTVQAVGRAGKDVYLTGGDNTSIGTWVAVSSVTLAAADQCPHCTSDRREWRFVMPNGIGTAACDNAWHDKTEETAR